MDGWMDTMSIKGAQCTRHTRKEPHTLAIGVLLAIEPNTLAQYTVLVYSALLIDTMSIKRAQYT